MGAWFIGRPNARSRTENVQLKEKNDHEDFEAVVSGSPELEQKKSILDGAKDFLNLDTVRRTVKTCADLFEVIQPAAEKPTWANVARAAFTVGKIIVEDLEVWSEAYFSVEEWTPVYSGDFNKIVSKALNGKKFRTIRTSEKNYNIRIVDLEGLRLGYVYNTNSHIVGNIYAETQHLEKTREKVKQLLWEANKDSSLIMRSNRRAAVSSEETRIMFEPDNVFESMPSARAEEYSKYLRKCIDAGVPRSVMLYGPPGTGKSTMARTIVEQLNLRSFRIRVEDVGNIETSTIFDAIDIFRPDAVVLDDFDRSHNQSMLLEILEFFQHRVKLVIATVNDRNQLDEAILRPGRFDEMVQIKQMDEDVVKLILGNDYLDSFEMVKDWPIAFIQEYVKRRKFMTQGEAEESIRELAMRVKRLDKYEEEDGTMKVLNKKRGRKQIVNFMK
jgi:ATPase family associated with various cellular activities (AAA)